MVNWYKLADTSLNYAFYSRIYQSVTSLGPLKLSPLLKSLYSGRDSGPQTWAKKINWIFQVNGRYPSPAHWVRGVNGIYQGGTVCLISTVSLIFFRNKKFAAAGIGTSLCWMGIAVHHLSKYSGGEHSSNGRSAEWFFKISI